MDFRFAHITSQLAFLLLLITGTALVQPLHASGMTPSDVQPAGAGGVKGKCELKEIVTTFVEAAGSGSSNGGDKLCDYTIIVENRCKYCDAKGVSVQVSGYLLGNKVINVPRIFSPGGDRYTFDYKNSQQVGGVSPASATFYECREGQPCQCYLL